MQLGVLFLSILFSYIAFALPEPPKDACDFLLGPKGSEWLQEKGEEAREDILFSRDGQKIAQKIEKNFDERIVINSWSHEGFVYTYRLEPEFPRGRVFRKQTNRKRSKLELVVDINEISEKFGKSFTLQEMIFFKSRALLEVSEGGSDHTSYIEIDLHQKQIVETTFSLGHNNGHLFWYDRDVVISQELRDLPLSQSGNPRELWAIHRDGTSRKIFELDEGFDFFLPSLIELSGRKYIVVNAQTSYHHGKFFMVNVRGQARDLPISWEANLAGQINQYLIFQLTEPWLTPYGVTLPVGSIVRVDADKLLRNQLSYHVDFMPGPTQSVANIGIGKTSIFAVVRTSSNWNYLIIDRLSSSNSRSSVAEVEGFPTIIPLDEVRSSGSWEVEIQDPIRSRRKVLVTTRGVAVPQEKLSPDLENEFFYEQLWAPGGKGVPTPYVVFRKKGPVPTRPVPTLIYCYGGFDRPASMVFSPIAAQKWLSEGGQIVYAMTRGGPEQGWVYSLAGRGPSISGAQDLINVAEDLVKRRYSSGVMIGAYGSSNAGRWIGLAAQMRPDLFRAVSLNSSVLNLKDFKNWGYGKVFLSEYGNGTDPSGKYRLQDYSPVHYQASNEVQQTSYLLQTARNDHRVWPEHSRQFARKLEQLGAKVYLVEHPEGGHDLQSNYRLFIDSATLQWTFFRRELGLAR